MGVQAEQSSPWGPGRYRADLPQAQLSLQDYDFNVGKYLAESNKASAEWEAEVLRYSHEGKKTVLALGMAREVASQAMFKIQMVKARFARSKPNGMTRTYRLALEELVRREAMGASPDRRDPNRPRLPGGAPRPTDVADHAAANMDIDGIDPGVEEEKEEVQPTVNEVAADVDDELYQAVCLPTGEDGAENRDPKRAKVEDDDSSNSDDSLDLDEEEEEGEDPFGKSSRTKEGMAYLAKRGTLLLPTRRESAQSVMDTRKAIWNHKDVTPTVFVMGETQLNDIDLSGLPEAEEYRYVLCAFLLLFAAAVACILVSANHPSLFSHAAFPFQLASLIWGQMMRLCEPMPWSWNPFTCLMEYPRPTTERERSFSRPFLIPSTTSSTSRCARRVPFLP